MAARGGNSRGSAVMDVISAGNDSPRAVSPTRRLPLNKVQPPEAAITRARSSAKPNRMAATSLRATTASTTISSGRPGLLSRGPSTKPQLGMAPGGNEPGGTQRAIYRMHSAYDSGDDDDDSSIGSDDSQTGDLVAADIQFLKDLERIRRKEGQEAADAFAERLVGTTTTRGAAAAAQRVRTGKLVDQLPGEQELVDQKRRAAEFRRSAMALQHLAESRRQSAQDAVERFANAITAVDDEVKRVVAGGKANRAVANDVAAMLASPTSSRLATPSALASSSPVTSSPGRSGGITPGSGGVAQTPQFRQQKSSSPPEARRGGGGSSIRASSREKELEAAALAAEATLDEFSMPSGWLQDGEARAKQARFALASARETTQELLALRQARMAAQAEVLGSALQSLQRNRVLAMEPDEDSQTAVVVAKAGRRLAAMDEAMSASRNASSTVARRLQGMFGDVLDAVVELDGIATTGGRGGQALREETAALREALRRSGGLVEALQSRATAARRSAEEAMAIVDEQQAENASLKSLLDKTRGDAQMLRDMTNTAQQRADAAEEAAASRLTEAQADELRSELRDALGTIDSLRDSLVIERARADDAAEKQKDAAATFAQDLQTAQLSAYAANTERLAALKRAEQAEATAVAMSKLDAALDTPRSSVGSRFGATADDATAASGAHRGPKQWAFLTNGAAATALGDAVVEEDSVTGERVNQAIEQALEAAGLAEQGASEDSAGSIALRRGIVSTVAMCEELAPDVTAERPDSAPDAATRAPSADLADGPSAVSAGALRAALDSIVADMRSSLRHVEQQERRLESRRSKASSRAPSAASHGSSRPRSEQQQQQHMVDDAGAADSQHNGLITEQSSSHGGSMQGSADSSVNDQDDNDETHTQQFWTIQTSTAASIRPVTPAAVVLSERSGMVGIGDASGSSRHSNKVPISNADGSDGRFSPSESAGDDSVVRLRGAIPGSTQRPTTSPGKLRNQQTRPRAIGGRPSAAAGDLQLDSMLARQPQLDFRHADSAASGLSVQSMTDEQRQWAKTPGPSFAERRGTLLTRPQSARHHTPQPQPALRQSEVLMAAERAAGDSAARKGAGVASFAVRRSQGVGLAGSGTRPKTAGATPRRMSLLASTGAMSQPVASPGPVNVSPLRETAGEGSNWQGRDAQSPVSGRHVVLYSAGARPASGSSAAHQDASASGSSAAHQDASASGSSAAPRDARPASGSSAAHQDASASGSSAAHQDARPASGSSAAHRDADISPEGHPPSSEQSQDAASKLSSQPLAELPERESESTTAESKQLVTPAWPEQPSTAPSEQTPQPKDDIDDTGPPSTNASTYREVPVLRSTRSADHSTQDLPTEAELPSETSVGSRDATSPDQPGYSRSDHAEIQPNDTEFPPPPAAAIRVLPQPPADRSALRAASKARPVLNQDSQATDEGKQEVCTADALSDDDDDDEVQGAPAALARMRQRAWTGNAEQSQQGQPRQSKAARAGQSGQRLRAASTSRPATQSRWGMHPSPRSQPITARPSTTNEDEVAVVSQALRPRRPPRLDAAHNNSARTRSRGVLPSPIVTGATEQMGQGVHPEATLQGDDWYPAAATIMSTSGDADEKPRNDDSTPTKDMDQSKISKALVQKQMVADAVTVEASSPRSAKHLTLSSRQTERQNDANQYPSVDQKQADDAVRRRSPSPPRQHGGAAPGNVVRRSPIGKRSETRSSSPVFRTDDSPTTFSKSGLAAHDDRKTAAVEGKESRGISSGVVAPAPSFAGRVGSVPLLDESKGGNDWKVASNSLGMARLAEENARLRETVTRLADGVARAQRAAVTVAAAASSAIASSSAHGRSSGSASGTLGANAAEVVPVPAGAVRALVLATDEHWCGEFVARDAIGLISQAVNERRRLRKIRARIGWAGMRDAILLKSRVNKLRTRRRSILGAIASGISSSEANEAAAAILNEPLPGMAGHSKAQAEAEPARRYRTAAEAGAVATRWLSRRASSVLHAVELQRRYLRGRASAAEATARAAIGVALFSAAASAMAASPGTAQGTAHHLHASAQAGEGSSALPQIHRAIGNQSGSGKPASRTSSRAGGSKHTKRKPPLLHNSAIGTSAMTAGGGNGAVSASTHAALWLSVPSVASRRAGELPAGGLGLTTGRVGGPMTTHGVSHTISRSSLMPSLAGDADPQRKAIVGAAGLDIQDAFAHAASVIAPTIAERALVVIARQWQPAKTPIKLAQQARDIRDRMLAAADAIAMGGGSSLSRPRVTAKAATSDMLHRASTRAEDASRWRMLARRHSAAELLELLVFALTGVSVPLV